ncbi:Uncharacterised protein [Neisseria zoodegmatis]|uniref:Uncharacterized protein n=1 Tax=Neisseria zoodegmatis TaxID=326523 RepID=A0A378WI21_9NEIS|nr:hypothetical protein [Neisseria zoodegmatis]SUA36682.1 Uncharacterised protein [Neisseria zoodegmatis]
MVNFKTLFSIFLYLIILKSEAAMTSNEIEKEKTYLFEMIHVAADIMNKNQPIDPNSPIWKQQKIDVHTFVNMKNGYTRYTLRKSETDLVIPKVFESDTSLNVSWGTGKDWSSLYFRKDDLEKHPEFKLKKKSEKTIKYERVFETDIHHYTIYQYSLTGYPNITIEFRVPYNYNRPSSLDYPRGFSAILVYRTLIKQ